MNTLRVRRCVRLVLLALGVGLAGSTARADVILPAIISSGMVVQQDSEVPIWGWATPGERIEVRATWGPSKYVAKANDNGEWRLFLRVPPATGVMGAQSIAIQGRNRVQIDDVLVGEVWVCSGQSNMEMFAGQVPGQLGGVDRWEEELKSANYPEIRLFDVANAVSATPLDDCKGSWSRCTPERAKAFSATALFFGREIHREMRVPVGLISSDWGGTPIQAWTSVRGLKEQGGFEPWVALLERMRDHPDEVKKENDDAAAAWRAGLNSKDAGVTGDWMNPDIDDAAWKSMKVPAKWSGELAGFDGIVWLRRTFELDAALAGSAGVLQLGPIDDHDETWVNGVKVGEHFEPGSHVTRRAYKVPAGALRAGKNVVTVRVMDIVSDGGMYGAPEDVRLGLAAGGNTTDLAGDWKWSIGAPLAQLPARPSILTPSPGAPSMLYNGMIAPIAGYGIRGVTWYQGESNRGEAYRYRTMFRAMIEDWRRVWDRGAFPFYFVQIAPFRYGNDRGETGELREAQAMALALPSTGMAVTMDIGDPADIHPRNKQEVGRRLALCALAGTYKRVVEYSGPVYQSMAIEGNAVRLTFDHAAGLAPANGPLTCFTIAGEDRKFVPADAKVEGETIVVRSDQVASPKAVRFAWGDADAPNLKNGAGLPAGPFRTDQWPGVTQPADAK